MPAATILESSVVLTEAGWATAARTAGEVLLYGVDRGGRIVHELVTLKASPEKVNQAWLGTSQAFGVFAPDTIVGLADGHSQGLEDIILGGPDHDACFEHFLDIGSICTPLPCPEEIWTVLIRRASFVDTNVLSFRVRLPENKLENINVSLGHLEDLNGPYLIMTRVELETAIRSDWREVVRQILALIFPEAEIDAPQLERSNYFLGLWYLAILIEDDTAYTLKFNTLQHSAQLSIHRISEEPVPIQRLATAFLAPQTDRKVQLSWVESSWAPLSSGFVLAGT